MDDLNSQDEEDQNNVERWTLKNIDIESPKAAILVDVLGQAIFIRNIVSLEF